MPRFFASGVWTGSEVVVWGGWDPARDQFLSDGAAYDPKADSWRVIADGPLHEREGHLAAWTGSEMLIWGGRIRNYIEPPDGAAYDPVTDIWREIAPGPLNWNGGSASIWTGAEWIIASTTSSDGRTRFAAYDPVADAWSTLPSINVSDRPTKSLAWTGDQLILRDFEGELYRLPKGAPEWIPLGIPDDLRLSSGIEWTGDHLLGIAWQHVNHQLFQFLVGWDPASANWLSVPQAPRYLGDRLVWGDGRLIVVGSDLAYDTASQAWWEIPIPDIEADYGNIVLWAGDRLFIWGGGLGHGTEPNDAGSVTKPDW
jgi:hypothetical protein